VIYDEHGDGFLHPSWRWLRDHLFCYGRRTSAKKICVRRLSDERMISEPHAMICAHFRSFASSVSARLHSFVRRTAFYRLLNDWISWLQPLASSVYEGS